MDISPSGRRCRSRSLPGAHAIRQALIEIVGAYQRLYPGETHPLPDFVACVGESERDCAGLQTRDEAQQPVAGGGVDKVHRACVYEHVLRWWMARGQRGPQPDLEADDTREEEVAAATPNQQSRESQCLGMQLDIAVGLLPRQ